jgi:hypothetical protein
MVTLTCNLTGGIIQQWRYDTENVGGQIIPAVGEVPEVPAVPLRVGGVEFQLSLLSTTPVLASQVAFVASANMDGRMVECVTGLSLSPAVTDTIVLQVRRGSECMFLQWWRHLANILDCIALIQG